MVQPSSGAKLLAVQFLHTLVGEFSSTKSSALRMSLEWHQTRLVVYRGSAFSISPGLELTTM